MFGSATREVDAYTLEWRAPCWQTWSNLISYFCDCFSMIYQRSTSTGLLVSGISSACIFQPLRMTTGHNCIIIWLTGRHAGMAGLCVQICKYLEAFLLPPSRDQAFEPPRSFFRFLHAVNPHFNIYLKPAVMYNLCVYDTEGELLCGHKFHFLSSRAIFLFRLEIGTSWTYIFILNCDSTNLISPDGLWCKWCQ
jgi:hypothetical protein